MAMMDGVYNWRGRGGAKEVRGGGRIKIGYVEEECFKFSSAESARGEVFVSS